MTHTGYIYLQMGHRMGHVHCISYPKGLEKALKYDLSSDPINDTNGEYQESLTSRKIVTNYF
jgi:hypothetical protein